MITKQAELKKQAYESSLKSRALSVLIYLIDRSNQDLTCFPAIPTMAEQLHISVSTVKRALKELVECGYIQKEARSRANNRGQSSNLYTLILLTQAPTPNNDNTLDHEDNIDVSDSKSNSNTSVTYISFATLQMEKQEQAPVDVAPSPCNNARLKQPQNPSRKAQHTPVHFAHLLAHSFTCYTNRQKKKQDNSCPAILLFIGGRGWGSICSPLELLKLTIYEKRKSKYKKHIDFFGFEEYTIVKSNKIVLRM